MLASVLLFSMYTLFNGHSKRRVNLIYSWTMETIKLLNGNEKSRFPCKRVVVLSAIGGKFASVS